CVALFTKAGRGLVRTHHGEQLQSGVGEAFAKLRDSCTLLKHEVEEAPFTLACPGSLLARWVIPSLDRLNQALPELKLQVVVSDAEQTGQARDQRPRWPSSNHPGPRKANAFL
ncbi:hypothetical protein ACFSW9_19100, partial [Sphingopyxis terrae subsp. ummariensis]